MNSYQVKTGGLLRCCLKSLDEEMERRIESGQPLAVEGESLTCVYEKHSEPKMIVKDGIWQWVGLEAILTRSKSINVQ